VKFCQVYDCRVEMYFLTQGQRNVDVRDSSGIAPHIRNFDTKRRGLVISNPGFFNCKEVALFYVILTLRVLTTST
jgi:hypothetical protein